MWTNTSSPSSVFPACRKRNYRGENFYFTRLAANMKRFIADYYKQNPRKAYGTIPTPWSLDAPIGHGSDTPRIDTVSEGLW
jgi:hypothetical protein